MKPFKLNLEELKSKEFNMNDYFKAAKEYSLSSVKQKEFDWSGRVLDTNKKDIIIFRTNTDTVNSLELKYTNKELLLPIDKMFIEIPIWKIEHENNILLNCGGIFIFKEIFEENILFSVSTFWLNYDKDINKYFIKPLSFSFTKGIINQDKRFGKFTRIGSKWDKIENYMGEPSDKLKVEVCETIKKIVLSVLYKIEKKEYHSYYKWTPTGFETKEIVYSSDVISHRRHFWIDSGRFKIPLMSKEQLETNGYGIDELVYRDGELRRDVPFRIINSYIRGEDKPKKEDNRIIEIFNKRILRQEEKIYRILKELFPNNLIRKHDRIALKGLELDFNIPELRIGIEYDGEQHFDKSLYNKLYGDGFEAQVKRDRDKEKLCARKNIRLIRIKFDEVINRKLIKNKIDRTQ